MGMTSSSWFRAEPFWGRPIHTNFWPTKRLASAQNTAPTTTDFGGMKSPHRNPNLLFEKKVLGCCHYGVWNSTFSIRLATAPTRNAGEEGSKISNERMWRVAFGFESSKRHVFSQHLRPCTNSDLGSNVFGVALMAVGVQRKTAKQQ